MTGMTPKSSSHLAISLRSQAPGNMISLVIPSTCCAPSSTTSKTTVTLRMEHRLLLLPPEMLDGRGGYSARYYVGETNNHRLQDCLDKPLYLTSRFLSFFLSFFQMSYLRSPLTAARIFFCTRHGRKRGRLHLLYSLHRGIPFVGNHQVDYPAPG
jgi:hypothetical protein